MFSGRRGSVSSAQANSNSSVNKVQNQSPDNEKQPKSSNDSNSKSSRSKPEISDSSSSGKGVNQEKKQKKQKKRKNNQINRRRLTKADLDRLKSGTKPESKVKVNSKGGSNRQSQAIVKEKVLKEEDRRDAEYDLIRQMLPKLNKEEHDKLWRQSRRKYGEAKDWRKFIYFYYANKELDAIENETGTASVSKATGTLSDALESYYDSENHHYCLLGNSPAVMQNALRSRQMEHNVLPLGGLTKPDVIAKYFGIEDYDSDLDVSAELIRGWQDEEDVKGQKVREYFTSFVRSIPEGKDIVVVDYAESGGSMVITADLLSLALAEENRKESVKLFSFSLTLPGPTTQIRTATNYTRVMLEPDGDDEQTFVTLTSGKYYKNDRQVKKGNPGVEIRMYKDYTLNELGKEDQADYEAINKRLLQENAITNERLMKI